MMGKPYTLSNEWSLVVGEDNGLYLMHTAEGEGTSTVVEIGVTEDPDQIQFQINRARSGGETQQYH